VFNLMSLKVFSIVLAFSVLLIATSAKGIMAQNATTNATNAIGNASASVNQTGMEAGKNMSNAMGNASQTANATMTEMDKNASSAAYKTGEAMQSTANAVGENASAGPIINESAENAEVKLTGPSSADPGKNVTLIGELSGLEENLIVSAKFVQVSGVNVSFSECTRGSMCTFPSMTFVAPDCSVNDNNLRFELSVTMTYSYVFNDTHTLKLKC
jgi:cytoskeletal protein RodZ